MCEYSLSGLVNPMAPLPFKEAVLGSYAVLLMMLPLLKYLELPFGEFPLNSGCHQAQTFQSSASVKMRTDGIFRAISY